MIPTLLLQTQNIKMLTALIEVQEINLKRRLLINIVMINQEMLLWSEALIGRIVRILSNLRLHLSMHSKEYHQKRSVLSITNSKFYISVSIVNVNAFVLNASSMVNTRTMMLRQSGKLSPQLRQKLINLSRHLIAMLRHYLSKRTKSKNKSEV